MSDEQTTLPLSDVTLERARQENDTIDEQFTKLEQRVKTLESEVEEKESELESVKESRNSLQSVVTQYRDQRADELLADIRATIEGAAVSEDDFDFEFADLEDADIDTLETVKSAVEATVEAAGLDQSTVSNQGSGPDLGSVENEDGPDMDEAARKAAADLGMEDTWQKVQAGETLAEPKHFDLGSSGQTDAADELATLLAEVADR